MRKHPRMLADAGVSPARYAELRDICRQYREMRQAEGLVARYGHHRMFLVHGGSDPTGNAAVSAARLPEARRVRIIDQAAADVGGRAIGNAIIKSVTMGATYARLRPPCGERQFYQLRLTFFVELDRMMWEMEMGQ